MDESCWRIVNGKLITISRKGADEVIVSTRTDLKTTLTVIATINAKGEKLPIWIIAHGKTSRCEEKYLNDFGLRKYLKNKMLIISHSENGWATAQLMHEYLKWLSRKNQKKMSYLIWDLHSSHRDESVKDYAHKKNIGLSYIPAGQTGE